jgi:hypothetical protein
MYDLDPAVVDASTSRVPRDMRKSVGWVETRSAKRRRTEVEKENVGVSDDVSEISGPRHSSAGPDPPETQQTVFAPCPLASRLSQALTSASAHSLPARHRCLRLSALLASFPRFLTGGCIPVCRVSRMDARRRLDLAAGQHAHTLPGRGTAPWLVSALCMQILFALASTISLSAFMPAPHVQLTACARADAHAMPPHRLPAIPTRSSPALL